MFVSPPPTSSTIPAVSPHAASSASPRSSRLRGLSYLRNIGNYTHSHILSRDQNPPSTSSPSTSPRRPISLLSRSVSLSHSSRNPTSASTAIPNPTVASTAGTQAAATNSINPDHRSRTANFRHSVIGTLAGLSNNDSSSSSSLSSPSPSPISTPPSRESSETSDHSGSPVTSDPEPPPQPHPRPAAAGAESRPAVAHSTAAASQLPTAVAPAAATTTTAAVTPSPSHVTQNMPAMSAARDTSSSLETLPSIRFSSYYDPRAARPSLTFQPLSRTLPTGSEVIKVGRYSERDVHPPVPTNCPTAAPVGFKSKVVSRRHCEFWFEGGKWYIKDVKSSSGTFLNHIRLSPPGTESKPFPVNDGDIIQLGIDFKGGEEMIFRCVKMRLELNRGWQSKLNAYNMSTHKRLRSLVANGSQNSTTSQDCSICLNSIAPCQSLFVAPCSHTWHYKCIRALLTSPQYPIFVCPNCRAAADLEAEVDDPSEEWQQITSEESADDAPVVIDATTTGDEGSRAAPGALAEPPEVRRDLSPETDSSLAGDVTMRVDMSTPSPNSLQPHRLQHAYSNPVPIPPALSASGAYTTRHQHAGAGPGALMPGSEGPITPRNNAGPWVFDGSAGGVAVAGAPSLAGGIPGPGIGEMRSLDSAALETTSRP